MFNVHAIDVETASGVTVQQTLIKLDNPSDKLLVVLPGRGYTNDSPVLYYLCKLGLEIGSDVLPVSYSFQYAKDRISPNAVTMDDLQTESQHAIDQALAHKSYKEVCIAGKSLGSPFASNLIHTLAIPEKRLILLTPIGDSVPNAGESVPTLIVIGTADGAFVDGQAEADTRANVTWKVYDKLDHGLEYADDWAGSIDRLRDIIGDCETFLK